MTGARAETLRIIPLKDIQDYCLKAICVCFLLHDRGGIFNGRVMGLFRKEGVNHHGQRGQSSFEPLQSLQPVSSWHIQIYDQ
jgi:hypothetical protein